MFFLDPISSFCALLTTAAALGDRMHAIEREQTYCRVIGAIALPLVIGLTVAWLKDATSAKPVQSSPAAVRPAPGTP